MRLWTVHPRYLDARGLVALWREGLLAKHVLEGRTRGYRHHPQLIRFRSHPSPLSAIDGYLGAVWKEAHRRGYAFDRTKIRSRVRPAPIPETTGQLAYEWEHLLAKLRRRAPAYYRAARSEIHPAAHPSFRLVAGRIRPWEKAVPARRNPATRPG